MPKPPVVKLPKTLGACADLLYETKNKRLALSKEVAVLEELEKALKEKIINELPASDASGVSGKLARVTINKKATWRATDWAEIWKYAKKKDAADIFQRRLSDEAINLRVDAGEKIKGLELFHYKSVGINKL
jgi:hypothetical protein